MMLFVIEWRKLYPTNKTTGTYSGLIRPHILHRAAEEPIFGLGMAEELARHGYRISPGTLYSLLHNVWM